MEFNRLILLTAVLASIQVFSQVSPPSVIGTVPTKQQLAWYELEMYAFVHFTTNNFTGKEWGYGDESPEIFNQTAFDA